ncbi:MAG: Asp-tRNA(Asn)/Glu-tRNA(Gln) amidotransferase subunit GatB [Oscillospiraceae bacterium]|nr:Asp-tRNA(Asn)/Glu-tRNA(Gln) amidotransferase subunit GatB [Oscillospiraceae bacterium]
MTWETVIGLEIHAELSTASKIFCACPTAFGGDPNTHVCPVCAGLPGALPKLNRAVPDLAVRLGLSLGCAIERHSRFDRKNYFYPDLPKAYQISQLYAPICSDGRLEINSGGTGKSIGIREIHIEEDAGKLVHDSAGGATLMDFNRCGVPLVEIVTQPDFRSGHEVIAFLEALREILLYLRVSDCKMQEGSLRADVNLSVRQPGGALGVRTEMKNLNSFRAIGRAIDAETARQISILDAGGRVAQETRRWDDDRGESYGMRSKENAQDYRYFPEPDLLPVDIDDAWLASVENNLPELASKKRARYVREYGLAAQEAAALTSHVNLSTLFEDIAGRSGEPSESAHLITGEIMRLLNQTNMQPEALSVDVDKLSALIGLVSGGRINRSAYKETVEAVFMSDVDPRAYIAEKGLMMQSDGAIIADAVRDTIGENPGAAAEYRAGKEKAFGYLMGQAMKRLGGSGDPEKVRDALLSALRDE